MSILCSGSAVVFWLLILVASSTWSQVHPAYDLVRDATGRVLDVVIAAGAYVDEDPERYRLLNESDRKQLSDQLDRFTGTMRGSLVHL